VLSLLFAPVQNKAQPNIAKPVLSYQKNIPMTKE
jgi:hypothetical protein